MYIRLYTTKKYTSIYYLAASSTSSSLATTLRRFPALDAFAGAGFGTAGVIAAAPAAGVVMRPAATIGWGGGLHVSCMPCIAPSPLPFSHPSPMVTPTVGWISGPALLGRG